MRGFIKEYVTILVGLGICFPCFGDLSGSLDPEAIRQRLQPVGKVAIDGAPVISQTTKIELTGPEKIYENTCATCHKTGVAGAPKWGDKAAWAPRIAAGKDVLFQHAIEGIRGMPPRGNCFDCTDDDLKMTVEYMITHAQ